MTYYVDNAPAYYSTSWYKHNQYLGLEYNVDARGDPVHTDPEDICDPVHQVFYIKVVRTDGPCDVHDIKQLLGRAVTPSPCYCEHDCCGHRHGFATVKPVTLDLYRAEVITSRNF